MHLVIILWGEKKLGTSMSIKFSISNTSIMRSEHSKGLNHQESLISLWYYFNIRIDFKKGVD